MDMHTHKLNKNQTYSVSEEFLVEFAHLSSHDITASLILKTIVHALLPLDSTEPFLDRLSSQIRAYCCHGDQCFYCARKDFVLIKA